MKFNIARQPLVPAFLTLVAIAALAMWRAGAGAMSLPEQAAIPTHGILAIDSPEVLLGRFQSAYPGWSKWIGAFLILFAGTSLGRLSLRYNLYSVGTCLAIPLYGIFITGLASSSLFLAPITAATLLTLCVKNFARAFCNGYAFDALFRASFYLGILPLVTPASLPLILILPLAIVLFHRTFREVVVALAGLLLPILTFCYVNWGAGGDFSAPLTLAAEAFTNGSPFGAVCTIPQPNLVILAGTILIDLTAIIYFLTDSYAAGNKPRAIFIFLIGLSLLLVPSLLNPVAKPDTTVLLAIPSALTVPFLLVRVHHLPALLLYLLLLAGSVAVTILQ